MSRQSLQIDDKGRLRHFLCISGLNQQLITEILKEDPRPPAQRQKKETFGMRLYDVNVRWQVRAASCRVRSCEKVG